MAELALKTQRPHFGALNGLQIDQEALSAELERIRALNRGVLTPAVIIEAARDVDNPLHDAFEWDDAVAAAKFRTIQARVLISIVTPVGEPPKYVSLVVEGHRAYLPTTQAAAVDSLREQMLRRAIASVLEQIARFKHIAGVAGVLERAKQDLEELLAQS